MKILYLTPGCFDKGGISRYNRYQIDALREIFGPHQVRVLSLLGPEKDAFESDFEVQWHGRGNGLFEKIRFVIAALKELMIWKPTHIMVAHVNFSGLAVMLGRLGGCQTILNVYGLEVWSGLSKDADFGLRRVDQVISDCHYTAQYIEAEGFRVKDSTTVIWDCVDLERFQPQPTQWEAVREKYQLPDREQYFVILTLGRLAFEAAHKGYDRLIQVFAALQKNYSQARLVIAGKGNMQEELAQQVAALGITDQVTFTGMVHDDDMAALYSYAHVFSLVSDRGKGRGEGIPLTPLEAMACEVPIIVGNQDGSQEAIFDDANGWVIDPFDLKAHQAFFEMLINDPQKRRSQAQNALKIARDTFSYQNFREKHRFMQKLENLER
ncbi:MAG: glycosyltransferase family 4 protein [Saprospiraceae bacterium]